MKKILFLLITVHCFAQAPQVEWQKLYGGSNEDYANYAMQTSDGGYVAVGATASNDGDVIGFYGGYDLWILKLNAAGELQWQQTLGANQFEYGYSVVETNDGNFMVAGSASSSESGIIGLHGGSDFIVIKVSPEGNIVWKKVYGGTQEEVAKSIIKTFDGGYILIGQTSSNDGNVSNAHGNYDYWVVKLSTTGVIEWQKTYGGTNDEYPFDIKQTNDGGYIAVGISNSNNGDITNNHGNWDSWVIKLSATGALEWQKSFGGSNDEGSYSITQTADNGYMIAGYTNSTDGDVSENTEYVISWFLKLDNNGNKEWQKFLRDVGCDTAAFTKQLPSGDYLIAGNKYTNDPNLDPHGGIGSQDIFLGKLDAMGNVLWYKILGDSGHDEFHSVNPTNDGGYVVAGSKQSFLYGSYTGNLWIAKLTADGQLATDTFQKSGISIVPNPASTFLNIKIENNVQIDKIRVVDLMGNIIQNQSKTCDGINLENIAAGVYCVEVYSGSHKYQTKFIKQ